MKIADISVSRVHSIIRVVGDRLVIKDNGSKFGTMIKLSKPTRLLKVADSKSTNNSVILQVARSIVYLNLESASQYHISRSQIPAPKPNTLFDPECNLMAYAPYKGTTFAKRIKLENQEIEYIPREFASNKVTYDEAAWVGLCDQMGIRDEDSSDCARDGPNILDSSIQMYYDDHPG
jgi:hypothetical protein